MHYWNGLRTGGDKPPFLLVLIPEPAKTGVMQNAKMKYFWFKGCTRSVCILHLSNPAGIRKNTINEVQNDTRRNHRKS